LGVGFYFLLEIFNFKESRPDPARDTSSAPSGIVSSKATRSR
jgi:hypothetical protein